MLSTSKGENLAFGRRGRDEFSRKEIGSHEKEDVGEEDSENSYQQLVSGTGTPASVPINVAREAYLQMWSW